MERPASLLPLQKIIEQLGTFGEVPAKGLPVQWLAGIGVVDVAGQWLVAREEWTSTGLKARSERDLLRKLAFRDPGYRFYLDTLLAQVLQGMALGGYINKVEELLDGRLAGFGPRLVNVLRLMQDWTAREVSKCEPAHWQGFREHFFGRKLLSLFNDWDNGLLGEIPGGPEQKFDILAEHYGSYTTAPVYIEMNSWGLESNEVFLLSHLIAAAVEGEGIYLPPELIPGCKKLIGFGLPVRRWEAVGYGQDKAACIGPVVLLVTKNGPGRINNRSLVRCPLKELTLLKVLSAGKVEVVSAAVRSLHEGFWSAVENSKRIGAFPGLDERLKDALPLLEEKEVRPAQRLTARQISDTAILALAGHPLFGLILQFFLAKSFEAGTGNDCITVTTGRVYYTPRTLFNKPERIALDIGDFEYVMDRIAGRIGIYSVAPLYKDWTGNWSFAVKRLQNIGGIFAGEEEIVLDQDFFQKRCHSWTPMAEVVQRGKGVREVIHQVLRQLWQKSKERIERRSGCENST